MSASYTRFWLALAALLALWIGLSGYEFATFGWHPAREEAPLADAWAWLRGSLTALVAFGMVASLAALPPDSGDNIVPSRWIAASWATLAVALGCCAVLLASPLAYQQFAAEDSAIEWLSALFLFIGSALFAWRTIRPNVPPDRRPFAWIDRIAMAGFAVLLFIMGMEEVSWFQRVIGFDTPDAVAQRNWQGEFNLHNFHTDLTELALYSATGVFLMLLPLLRERAGRWRLIAPFTPLLPDRSVAALSAPMLAFTYSHWNLIPVQSMFWTGIAVCLIFARSASLAGRRREAVLFGAMLLFVALGQAFYLAMGHTMLAIFDSSEYRELFIAIGLCGYAIRQTSAERA